MRRCGICDESYDECGDRAKLHEHPEPQSGKPRDDFIAARLPYDRWILETVEGRDWAEFNKNQTILKRYVHGTTNDQMREIEVLKALLTEIHSWLYPMRSEARPVIDRDRLEELDDAIVAMLNKLERHVQ